MLTSLMQSTAIEFLSGFINPFRQSTEASLFVCIHVRATLSDQF